MKYPKEPDSTFQIDAPMRFVAGGLVEGSTVVHAAPIIRYMLGWDLTHVYDHCKKKRWKLTLLPYRKDEYHASE